LDSLVLLFILSEHSLNIVKQCLNIDSFFYALIYVTSVQL